MEDITASYLNPRLNDVAHVLLLGVALDNQVVRADVLDCIDGHHVLILVLTFALQVLTLEVIQVSALHAHGDKDLVLGVETSPPGAREGDTRHLHAIAPYHLTEGDLLDHLQPEE